MHEPSSPTRQVGRYRLHPQGVDAVSRRRVGRPNPRGKLATLTGPFLLRAGLSEPGAMSVFQAWELVWPAWCRQVDEGTVSESIVVTYQTELRAFFGVLTRQGVTRLGDVLSNHVRAYCEMPDKNGALPAASTKPKRRSAVSSFFETCRVLGLVDQNPTMGVVFPPRPSRYVGAFDDVAIQQLRNVSCSVLGDTRTPSMFALVLCGAAPKELVNVTVADVDLAQGRVWLHDGGYRCRDRWVSFLDDWCATAIRNRVNEMRATYGAEADAVWLVYKPHPSKPTPTRQDSAGSSVMSRLLDKARVHNPGKNRTESIREWVAATVFEETGSLEEVALRLGMASLDAAAHLVGYDWLEVSGHDFTPPAHRLAEAGGPS